MEKDPSMNDRTCKKARERRKKCTGTKGQPLHSHVQTLSEILETFNLIISYLEVGAVFGNHYACFPVLHWKLHILLHGSHHESCLYGNVSFLLVS